jgi:hypothetical protein
MQTLGIVSGTLLSWLVHVGDALDNGSCFAVSLTQLPHADL